MGKISLLIVEDEALMGMYLRRALERAGFALMGVVGNGPEAVRRATEERPDLVLMDVRLSGPMDGIQAATLIRAVYERLPIILMSGYSTREILERAYAVQPTGILEKPFQLSELLACIRLAVPEAVEK